MDDLEDLKVRVAAAQEKLRLTADDQRKYGLRLNDVVTIVEGSLARQQDEMKRLQDSAVQLRLERDATRVAENQTKSLYEAALSRLNLLQTQNEQLRSMVMTLLNVIEGRETAGALQGVLQRLESTVHEIAAAPALEPEESVEPEEGIVATPMAAAADAVAVAADEPLLQEPAAMASELSEADAPDAGYEFDSEAAKADVEPMTIEASDLDSTDEVMEPVELSSEMEFIDTSDAPSIDGENDNVNAIEEEDKPTQQPMTEVDPGAAMASLESDGGADSEDALSEDMPEDLGTLSMNDHQNIVTDADAIVEDEALDNMEIGMTDDQGATSPSTSTPTVNGKQDEILVTALLDAEKALIEAGASGVANANSPVAEIIRRISLRTREFSEASGV